MALIAALVAGVIIFVLLLELPHAPSSSASSLRDWHDNANVIRIDEKAPPGFDVCLAWGCRVAGISYREADAEDFVAGCNRRLELVREPDNPVSPLAVKVIGEWDGTDGKARSAQLGYLPREIARSIADRAPQAKLAAALRDLFIPMDGKGAGIRLKVWGDSQLDPAERRRQYARRRRAEKNRPT